MAFLSSFVDRKHRLGFGEVTRDALARSAVGTTAQGTLTASKFIGTLSTIDIGTAIFSHGSAGTFAARVFRGGYGSYRGTVAAPVHRGRFGSYSGSIAAPVVRGRAGSFAGTVSAPHIHGGYGSVGTLTGQVNRGRFGSYSGTVRAPVTRGNYGSHGTVAGRFSRVGYGSAGTQVARRAHAGYGSFTGTVSSPHVHGRYGSFLGTVRAPVVRGGYGSHGTAAMQVARGRYGSFGTFRAGGVRFTQRYAAGSVGSYNRLIPSGASLTERKTQGESSSATATTLVAQLAAAAGNKFVGIVFFGRTVATGDTQMKIIVTYTDDTTTNIDTTGVSVGAIIIGNSGGFIIWTVAGAAPTYTALDTAKAIKTIRAETLSDGTGARTAAITALETAI